jgi:hypothetical protein
MSRKVLVARTIASEQQAIAAAAADPCYALTALQKAELITTAREMAARRARAETVKLQRLEEVKLFSFVTIMF